MSSIVSASSAAHGGASVSCGPSASATPKRVMDVDDRDAAAAEVPRAKRRAARQLVFFFQDDAYEHGMTPWLAVSETEEKVAGDFELLYRRVKSMRPAEDGKPENEHWKAAIRLMRGVSYTGDDANCNWTPPMTQPPKHDVPVGAGIWFVYMMADADPDASQVEFAEEEPAAQSPLLLAGQARLPPAPEDNGPVPFRAPLASAGHQQMMYGAARYDANAYATGTSYSMRMWRCNHNDGKKQCSKLVLFEYGLCNKHVRKCHDCCRALISYSAMNYAKLSGAQVTPEWHWVMWYGPDMAKRAVYCSSCVSDKKYETLEHHSCSAWCEHHHSRYPVTLFRCTVGARDQDYTTEVVTMCSEATCSHCRRSVVWRASHDRGDVVINGNTLFCGECAGINSIVHCELANCRPDDPKSSYLRIGHTPLSMCTRHVCTYAHAPEDRVLAGACRYCQKWVNLGCVVPPNQDGHKCGDGEFAHFECEEADDDLG